MPAIEYSIADRRGFRRSNRRSLTKQVDADKAGDNVGLLNVGLPRDACTARFHVTTRASSLLPDSAKASFYEADIYPILFAHNAPAGACLSNRLLEMLPSCYGFALHSAMRPWTNY